MVAVNIAGALLAASAGVAVYRFLQPRRVGERQLALAVVSYTLLGGLGLVAAFTSATRFLDYAVLGVAVLFMVVLTATDPNRKRRSKT